MHATMVFLSMKRWTEKYISNDKLHRENDRALYRFWSTSETWRPRTAPNHFTPFSLFLIPISSLLHRRYSTVNNIDSVIYPTIQNHSLRYQATKEERRTERRKKRRAGREGGKKGEREVEEKEREREEKSEGKVYQTRRTKKERQIFTQPWLEIPWSLSYTLFNAIEFPLPSPFPFAPPSLLSSSFSICRPRMHRRYPLTPRLEAGSSVEFLYLCWLTSNRG